MMISANRHVKPRGSTHKSPLLTKENNEDTPQSEQKIAGRDIFGAKATPASGRQALSAVNAKCEEAEQGSTPRSRPLSGEGEGGASDNGLLSTTAVMTKEEVEALLTTKMKGKSKFDHKGKSEQMAEYIKKLRACVRHFQELDELNLSEKERLRTQLLEEQNEWNFTESTMRNRISELDTGIAELRVSCSGLEEKVSKLHSENEALLLARESDGEALDKAEKERNHLLQEIDSARKDHINAIEQVASLQEVNKKLQEYNSSLQLYNNKLESDVSAMAETISMAEREKVQIMESLDGSRTHSANLEEQLEHSKALIEEGTEQNERLKEKVELLHAQVEQAVEEIRKQNGRIERLNEDNMQYEERLQMSAADLEVLTIQASALEESRSLHIEQINTLHHELVATNDKLCMAEKSVLEHLNREAEQRIKVEDLQERLAQMESQMREGELLRKKLHNSIQELKGNIRVFCRVRPFLADEDLQGSELPVINYCKSMELSGRGIEIIQNQGQKHMFVFDKVFGPEAGQDSVFAEVSQLIQSALDGYKVCIFAYGQTGSGKTHTMLGNTEIPNHKGVIPRSLEQLFKASQDLGSRGWTFRMQASMLEIYNEAIRDLLAGSKGDSPAKLHVVRHDQNGETAVQDLTIVDVTNWDEVSSLLSQASQSRAVGKTIMNEQSSRSHCVFTLRISGFNETTGEQVNGTLNLIDLAGSERLSRTGSTGERLKETQAINKSLACLGDVIMSIANKEQHVPYRNSKLTYLLQPCLGGDSKILMFVNISPDPKSVSESLCSLRFAAKVNACEMDVPRRQIHLRTLG